MSGRDERPLKDYPICPKCYERFTYWVGRFGGNDKRIAYFNPEKHQSNYKTPPFRVYDAQTGSVDNGTREVAEEVTIIYCYRCSYQPDPSTFKQIIKAAVNYIERER